MFQTDTIPTFYKRYTDRVAHLSLTEALTSSGKEISALMRQIPETSGMYRYEPGKWSIKEVLCHMMDAERIFAYRALRFARNDKTELHGFEENDYAPEANAHARTLSQLAEEMDRLRLTTCDLFSSFTPEMLKRVGTANGTKVSVEVVGYITAGHTIHHKHILTERYLK